MVLEILTLEDGQTILNELKVLQGNVAQLEKKYSELITELQQRFNKNPVQEGTPQKKE